MDGSERRPANDAYAGQFCDQNYGFEGEEAESEQEGGFVQTPNIPQQRSRPGSTIGYRDGPPDGSYYRYPQVKREH